MKNVFLIGDSIRKGYCETVKKNLADIADVRFPSVNCRCTQYTLVSLWEWLDIFEKPENVDYIHWNNGHWDVAHWYGEDISLNSPEEYAIMLKRVYRHLKKLFPNAKIVFATTTPMNPNKSQGGNPRTTEEIMVYNQVALKVMNELGVEVDDLFSAMKDAPSELYKDYCHYTTEGFEKLGNIVADFIRRTI